MTQSEAAEKIKKLLKHKGRTEAEADTAQILAAALAEKHGIDIAALDAQEDTQRNVITHRAFGKWLSVPPEAVYAALICQEFFEARTITIRRHDTETWCVIEEKVFVGTSLHLEIAEYIFNFLLKEFRWQWNKKRGRCKKRKQFMWGCYVALVHKLQERFARPNDGSTALEVSLKAKRDAYMEEQWPNAKSCQIVPKEQSSVAARRGFRAGKDIEIRPGVNPGEQNDQKMLPGFAARLLPASTT